MTDSIKWCRHCIHFYPTTAWQGNCSWHHWEEDKFSQDADAGVCPDYTNKWAQYDARKKVKCQAK